MAAAPFQPRSRRSKGWMPFFVAFGFVGGFILVIAALILVPLEYFGSTVSGFELDPSTFAIRKYEYREGFLTGRQRTSLDREPGQQSSLARMLSRNGYLPATNTSRWDLAIHQDNEFDKSAIAYPLHILLRSYSFNSTWETWTLIHPRESAMLWPAVVELAGQGCYGDIPTLLEQFSESIPDDPANVIDLHLKSAYESQASFQTDPTRVTTLQTLAAQPFSARNPVPIPPAPAESDLSESAQDILDRSNQTRSIKPLDLPKTHRFEKPESSDEVPSTSAR